MHRLQWADIYSEGAFIFMHLKVLQPETSPLTGADFAVFDFYPAS